MILLLLIYRVYVVTSAFFVDRQGPPTSMMTTTTSPRPRRRRDDEDDDEPDVTPRRVCLVSFAIATGLVTVSLFAYALIRLLFQALVCGWDPRQWPRHEKTGSDVCFPLLAPSSSSVEDGVLLLFTAWLTIWGVVVTSWMAIVWTRRVLQQRNPSRHHHHPPSPPVYRYLTTRREAASWDDKGPERADETTLLVV